LDLYSARVFLFSNPAPPDIYTLSLHDALPICKPAPAAAKPAVGVRPAAMKGVQRSFEFVGRIKAVETVQLRARVEGFLDKVQFRDRKSTRLNSSHVKISYAVFCLKKKKPT